MQVEDNAKKKQMFFLICIVETPPTLSKGSANRREYKINLFIFILEVQPAFTAEAVNSANRREYKINLFIFILEVQPILTKEGLMAASRRVDTLAELCFGLWGFVTVIIMATHVFQGTFLEPAHVFQGTFCRFAHIFQGTFCGFAHIFQGTFWKSAHVFQGTF